MQTLEETRRLLECVKSFSTVMLISISPDGTPAVRPMHVSAHEEDGVLWLPTNLNSPKVEEIDREFEVHVTGQKENSYFAATAVATIHSSQATKDRLWSESLKIWFPEGKEDPTLGFIRLKILRGEFWDLSGFNKVMYAAEAVKAFFMGRTPDTHHKSWHGHAVLLGGVR